jgi:hypothetical protein
METGSIETAQMREAAHAWRPEAAGVHEGSLDGATLTGEAARRHLSIRIGLWLDEAGSVKQARWRSADDPILHAYAEAVCLLVESGANPFLIDGDALMAAVAAPCAGDRPNLVLYALRAALLLWQGGRD